jgi:hypothetical protein
VTTSPTRLGLAVLVLTALLGCGSADDTGTRANGSDATAEGGSGDSGGTDETTSDDGAPLLDMTVALDLGLDTCWTDLCAPALLGDCGPPEQCNNDGYECSFSHDFSSINWPTRCAIGSEVRHGEHEMCETMDTSGLQTCEKGMACIGPAGDEFGSCHPWCASQCSTPGDVCLDLTFPETSIGGFCVRTCNPLDLDACSHTGASICADLLGQPAVSTGATGYPQQSYFACIPSLPGLIEEREQCHLTEQHNSFGGDGENAACAPGLTCANYQFADQTFRRLQCLRVCDAPEDCAPTEICVSNAEYTEAVGAPIGVCEAM